MHILLNYSPAFFAYQQPYTELCSCRGCLTSRVPDALNVFIFRKTESLNGSSLAGIIHGRYDGVESGRWTESWHEAECQEFKRQFVNCFDCFPHRHICLLKETEAVVKQWVRHMKCKLCSEAYMMIGLHFNLCYTVSTKEAYHVSSSSSSALSVSTHVAFRHSFGCRSPAFWQHSEVR